MMKTNQKLIEEIGKKLKEDLSKMIVHLFLLTLLGRGVVDVKVQAENESALELLNASPKSKKNPEKEEIHHHHRVPPLHFLLRRRPVKNQLKDHVVAQFRVEEVLLVLWKEDV